MATNYPGSLDSWSNPDQNTPENAVGHEHDLRHADLNDAVEAIEGELGTNPSGTFSTVSERFDNVKPSDALWTPNGTPVWADEFDSASLDPNWVRADAVGTAARVTWTQGNSCLSARHDGSVAEGASTHYLLYPLSSAGGDFVPGDALVTGFAGAHNGWNPQYVMTSLALANGVAHGTSNAVANQWYTATSNDHQMRAWSNALMTTDGAQSGTITQQHGGFYFRRIVMTAANTWRADYSPDGVSWLTVLPNPLSYTLTPTHLGFGVSTWTTAYQFISTFFFIRRYSGVS